LELNLPHHLKYVVEIENTKWKIPKMGKKIRYNKIENGVAIKPGSEQKQNCRAAKLN